MNSFKPPMRVLVVEDEALIALNVESVLADLGHTVIGPCASAHQAYRRVATNPPDLALVDLNLSDGKTGLGLAQFLASTYSTIVVMATANPEGIEAGGLVFAVLRKPYTDQALANAVERAAVHVRTQEATELRT